MFVWGGEAGCVRFLLLLCGLPYISTVGPSLYVISSSSFPVTPLPNQTHRSLIKLPTLPHGDNYSPFQPTEDLLVPIIAVVTALSLTASIGLTVILGWDTLSGWMWGREGGGNTKGARKHEDVNDAIPLAVIESLIVIWLTEMWCRQEHCLKFAHLWKSSFSRKQIKKQQISKGFSHI